MAHARSAEASTETGSERPLRLRPRFIVLLIALRYLLPAVVVGVGLGAMGGVLIGLVTGQDPGAVVLPAMAVGIPLAWLLLVVRTAGNYLRTEYRLHDDRIEYEEGFLGREHKELPWSRVTECTLRQGVLQRAYGVGTIVLATPATGPTGSTAGSGLKIADVERPDAVYAEVRARVKAAQR